MKGGVERRNTSSRLLRSPDLRHPLYIGGIVPTIYTKNYPSMREVKPFVGCIRELEFNDRMFELSGTIDIECTIYDKCRVVFCIYVILLGVFLMYKILFME